MSDYVEPFTEAEFGAAKELGIPVQTLRLYLDTYMEHCKLGVLKRRAERAVREKEKNG